MANSENLGWLESSVPGLQTQKSKWADSNVISLLYSAASFPSGFPFDVARQLDPIDANAAVSQLRCPTIDFPFGWSR